jgi:hypothetical protein
VTTWIRRALIAAAVLFMPVGTGTAAGAATGPPAPAVPETQIPLTPEGQAAPSPSPTASDTPTTTQTPTPTPTAPPTTDDPVTETPTPPQDTDITGSVAVPAGGGGAQVGGLPRRVPQQVPRPPTRQRPRAEDPGGLAATGPDVALPLGIAAILLLGGTGAILAGRPRRRP